MIEGRGVLRWPRPFCMRRRHERRPPDLGFVHRYVPAQTRRRSAASSPARHRRGTKTDLLPLGRALSRRARPCCRRAGRSAKTACRVSSGGWPKASGICEDLQAPHRRACRDSCAARARGLWASPSRSRSASPTARISPGRCCCTIRRTLGGAILMRAMLPFDPRPLPDLDGLSVLILAGATIR